jgi:hypothetical protein
MTLGFSTKWPKHMGELAGQPNYFIDKIWSGLLTDLKVNVLVAYVHRYKYRDKFEKDELFLWDKETIKPKFHTIRTGNRWKAGMQIHPVINNRTKDRFQFAPTIECISVQKIEIKEVLMTQTDKCVVVGNKIFVVEVDGVRLRIHTIKFLAINDGFPTVEAFFQYFNTDFKGQIIHWTDLKY